MKVRDIAKKSVFSLEVFPPKKSYSPESISRIFDRLAALEPGFISVTYGAGGSNIQQNKTVELCRILKQDYHVEPVAHLTCFNSRKDEVLTMLELMKEQGIENILALRGDRSPDITPPGDFRYACELIDFIRSHTKEDEFDICAACYPEGHPECGSLKEDVLNLKHKVDAGVSLLISQLFFDNEDFYRFRELCDVAGIKVPLHAGIMPVTNKSQIERMVSTCGASLPKKLSRMMARYENNPQALMDAGISYATEQIVDLLASGVEGIHLYAMNRPKMAEKIKGNISSLLDARQ